jgi:hypothetical protein
MSNVSPVFSSPELELLAMMIENDSVLSEADRQARDAARSAQRDAMEEELEAIAKQADAIRIGAILEGGLTVAGSGLSFTHVVENGPKEDGSLSVAGKGISGLADDVGQYFGEACQKDAEHDAVAARQDQQQASWLQDDAESALETSERHAEQMLEHVQNILRSKNDGTAAVLSNV